MDILTSRQIDFIKLMLEESEYKPIKYFTEKLNVSDKTLQKDLKIIGNYISKFNVKIDAKRGYGILIDSNASSNIEFINNLNINLKEKNSVSVDQRRVEILKMLLLNSNSSTSINQLSEKYYVSKTSIVNDLKYIEEWLKKYNIKLSKTLEGTKILGKETDIRKSIASLLEDILDQNNEEDKLPEITRIELSTFSALSNIFDLDSIMFIESIIWELEENLDYTISQPYYINLITHILICIKRLKEGNQIESKEDKIKLLDNLNEKVYENVINLIGKIEERYGVSINNEEIYYIYKYIVSSGFGNALDNNRLISENYINNSEEVTNMMIDIMSEFLNINLREDELLQKGLLLHIKPMLNRLNYDIQIKNPLLKEIKERFSEILGLCMLSIRLMSPYYNITNISIDEISYIATYFQAAVERSVSSKRVLVVCHSGYGTSQLLATRLKRAFPQWTIVDIVSVHRLSEVDMTNIDFIVSSVDIDIKDKMYIVVSALLMDRDVNNIKNVLMNASSEENSRNFNNLALEMEGNIFFNGNYNKEIDYILSNVKLEQVNLSKYYKIYINTSYEENKLIT
ncbi:BglG family transcription antiterminator, partial [Terrisporobacter muris]